MFIQHGVRVCDKSISFQEDTSVYTVHTKETVVIFNMKIINKIIKLHEKKKTPLSVSPFSHIQQLHKGTIVNTDFLSFSCLLSCKIIIDKIIITIKLCTFGISLTSKPDHWEYP